ncbi:AMMECR1 domain-containing protein, partial [Myxococcota bacterium]|nr:AMMECR1 domain-containing protein [Myxococcota bacterium]
AMRSDESRRDAALTLSQATVLLHRAYAQLLRAFGHEAALVTPDGPLAEVRAVNLTLRRRGVLRASMSGAGPSILDAVDEAARRAASDARYGGGLCAAELHQLDLELWVNVGVEDVTEREPKRLARLLPCGVVGVELKVGDKSAYFKPSVALTSGLTTPELLLGRLARKAGLPKGAWRRPTAKLSRTIWRHFVLEQGERAVELRRLRPFPEPEVSRETLSLMLEGALARLLRVQRADGSYAYQFDGRTDAWDHGAFNLVRMAGSAYSVSRAAAFLPQDHPLRQPAQESARRALDFLLARATPFPHAPHADYIAQGLSAKERGQGKLGALALTILATEYGDFPTQLAEARRRMLDGVLTMQRADGLFRCSVGVEETGEEANQDYYPGEALLALAGAVRLGETPRAPFAMLRALRHYQARFARAPTSAFVLWQSDAWRSFLERQWESDRPVPWATDEQVESIRDFVWAQIELLLARQVRPRRGVDPQRVGGFATGNASPTAASTVYAEAIARAAELAKLCGDLPRARRYAEAARLAFAFAARLYLWPCQRPFFVRPELVLGGSTLDLNGFILRNDFEQHLITAIIAALETDTLWRG